MRWEELNASDQKALVQIRSGQLDNRQMAEAFMGLTVDAVMYFLDSAGIDVQRVLALAEVEWAEAGSLKASDLRPWDLAKVLGGIMIVVQGELGDGQH